MTNPAQTTPIRIGICGHGNLGRGVEKAISHNPDMVVTGIYTRRSPDSITPQFAGTPVHHMDALPGHADQIDVLILCGGSKEDLPQQGPKMAEMFNIVDSFDTHARIPEYFASVDAVASPARRTALISSGWDPGMFSINRVMSEAIVPNGTTYTFWGKGLSQGHSDAIRRVPGVAGGVQYTIPAEDAIAQIRAGNRPELSTREKHKRECYVVAEEGADKEAIREAIVTMEHYFAEYDTTVNFISAEELARDHNRMPHGGFVIRSGESSEGVKQVVEYGIKLDSNPEFTSSILVAYARAVHRMYQAGQYGAKTVFDVPPALLSAKTPEQLRADYL